MSTSTTSITREHQSAPKSKDQFDLDGAIMDFEDGNMEEPEVIELFQHLVDSGMAWQLQGSYGRMAKRLIDAGRVTARN